MAGITHQFGILGQYAPFNVQLGLFPFLPPPRHLLFIHSHVDPVAHRVNRDFIPVPHQSDGSSRCGFGHNVAHDETMRGTTVPAIRHERNVAQAGAHDGCRGSQLLRHARSALGSFVPHNEHKVAIRLLDVPPRQGQIQHVLLVKRARFAGEDRALFTGDFGHGAAGGKVTAQDADVPGALDGVLERADDLLVGVQAGPVVDVFGKSSARDGGDVAVEYALVDEQLEHGGRAANLVEVLHVVLAARGEVSEERRGVASGGDVVEGEGHAGRVGHGEEVQNAIGGTSQNHGEPESVLEGAAGEKISRTDILLHGGLDDRGNFLALAALLGRQGRIGAGAGEGETHGLNGRGHGVGGVHAAAGTGSGAGVALNVFHDIGGLAAGLARVGLGVEAVVRVRPGGLVAGANVDLLFQQGGVAFADGASVDHDEGPVVPGGSHDDAGHVLVAAGDGNVSIVVLGAGDSLNGVGDDFTGLQGEPHAFGEGGQ